MSSRTKRTLEGVELDGDAVGAARGAAEATALGGKDGGLVEALSEIRFVSPTHLGVGMPAVIEVRNLSATEHPFHLHGQVFEVLAIDGVAPPVRLVEDTVNIGLNQTVRLALVADNSGDWMAHCHILPHAHGMMTVLRVGP